MAILRWRNGTPYNPFREIERLQNEINSLFSMGDDTEYTGLFDRAMSPAVDIIDAQDEYRIIADMPGVEQKDLDISVASHVLTIKGEKKPIEKLDKVKTYRKDTWEGHFQRTLSLPKTIDSEKIKASLKNGVLTVSIPKREEEKPKQISVKVQ